ncbi:hypothetical protein CALVIDRAFT_365031 [Calocera viscosa TUFC12733]|uniref:Uncharacterized protein n=1 Tax=Calocera viscosa (strain TUFC12733) TaxID=1330018 RepID=A0A167H5W5_CALVF|nr:hypothetical protein CALVIDRAFT_365031 [Calocera viscosa TUFC12733]
MGFLTGSRSRKSVRSNKTRQTLASLTSSAPSSSSSPPLLLPLPPPYAPRARSLPPPLPPVVYNSMPTIPLIQLPYAPGHPQYMTYVPGPYGAPHSPPMLTPLGVQRPPMSRASSGKLHSPRKDRERERMSRAYTYAASPPPASPISPMALPVQRPHAGVQINTRGAVLPPTILPGLPRSPAAPANQGPGSPVYYPPITRFCPHCNSRVPTEHHFQFCSSCQRPLSAYPQRPPSVVPDADGFAIPGIAGMPPLNPRELGRNGAGRSQPLPTHKMNISEAPTVSSAIGSPVYSSPASSPIGSLDGGGLGSKVGIDAGPGSMHPAGREALVLPNGKATKKLEALSVALADWLCERIFSFVFPSLC